MTAWSKYLREQAVVAERASQTMTDPDTQREFEEIAASYRRDADLEEASASAEQKRPTGSCLNDAQPTGPAAPISV